MIERNMKLSNVIILNRVVHETIINNPEIAAAFFAIHHCQTYTELYSEAFLEAERNNEIRTLDKAILAVERANAYRCAKDDTNRDDYDCVTSTHEV
jgi:hypothetical protein